jgi:NDP-sugar pyrophosphorylase family protein
LQVGSELVNGMLLAAGRGARMEPLSSVVPKPALEVLGAPLLATAARQVSAHCARLVVNLHRHPRQIVSAVREVLPQRRVHFSWEPELLGGAGGIAAARPYFGPGFLLVGNADTHSDLDLQPLLAATEEDVIVLGLVAHPAPDIWSSVYLESGGRVVAILPAGSKASGTPFLFTGFQILGAGVLRALPAPPAEMPPVWRALQGGGRLRGVVLSGWWREAGDVGAYRELVTSEAGPFGWHHTRAAVADNSRIERSAVGRGCGIGAAARLCETVVTAGAAVGARCELTRCVVAGQVTVAADTRAQDELVTPAGRFPLIPPTPGPTGRDQGLERCRRPHQGAG